MKKIIILLTISFLSLSSCGTNKKNLNPEAKNKLILEKYYKKYKGTPYHYGGTTSLGFDCSGFVQRVYNEAFKIDLPRTTKGMMKSGNKINQKKLKIGDLVFFHTKRKVYHVGIYMGNRIFMHASSSKGVTKSSLDNSYWKKKYIFSRRVLKAY